jgi:hypothetical protein
MTHLIAALCLLLISTSAIAELGPQAITLSGMSDCLKEAIGNNSVEQNGNTLFFSCSEAKAKILFNLLARKIRAEVVQDPNGKFENRQFGNSACYHRVEDAAGKPADDFRCDLVILTGDALLD